MTGRTKKEATPAQKAVDAAKTAYDTAKDKHTKQANDANTTALAKAKMALNNALAAVNRERFENVVGGRVAKLITTIQTLRNGSNRRSYGYTEADVQKMFASIDGELKMTRNAFESALKSTGKEKGAVAAKFTF